MSFHVEKEVEEIASAATSRERSEMKLWEIGEMLEQILLDTVDPETGEIREEGLRELEAAEHDFKQKALAVAKFIEGQRLEATGVKTKAGELMVRAKRLETHAEHLEEYLQHQLQTHGVWLARPEKNGNEVLLSDHETVISARKSEAVVYVGSEDGLFLPEELTRLIPESREPDKKAIKQALKAGKGVPGWLIERRTKIKVGS